MIRTILGFFGYSKIPLEAVRLSILSESLIAALLKEAMKKSEKQQTIDFVKTALNGQKALTEFLRSGKLLQ